MKFSQEYPYLTEKTASFIELDDAQRIEKIKSRRWITYPAANQILNKLEDLLIHPKTHRMPNLLIVGNTNNGKTMLIKQFLKKHPPSDRKEEDACLVPVLYIQAPPTPDEVRLYNAILYELFAPSRQNDRIDKKAAQVFKIMRYVGVKVLIIDEIHDILAGSLNKQRAFLNVIKHLGNELQIPIVGIGTKDAFRAIQTDPQLANRFTPAILPDWEFNEDYLRLLSTFEIMLPLKNKSTLTEIDLARKIYSMSDGLLGEISSILVNASVQAIESGKEKISIELLDELDWIPPSQRRRHPEQVM